MSVTEPTSKGVLFPARSPRISRYAPPTAVEHLVRHVWIPEWDLPEGMTAVQRVLSYPATNLVVEADRVVLSGPYRHVDETALTGSGWAVGMMLRPAGASVLGVYPRYALDADAPFDAGDLGDRVRAARASSPEWHIAAIDAMAAWLLRRPEPTEDALEANRIVATAESDPSLTSVAALAAAVHLSLRTVHRRIRDHVGLTPLAVLRRYRLQEAADRIRRRPDLSLGEIALATGFADQAHFGREFRVILGRTPGQYRREVG